MRARLLALGMTLLVGLSIAAQPAPEVSAASADSPPYQLKTLLSLRSV